MSNASYDSRPDTLEHIRNVQSKILAVTKNLGRRAIYHDASKLASPEVEAFDRETPLLQTLTYGSEEYKESLKRLGEALQHHYKHNAHHPEFYSAGINGMSLLDLIEMLVDWKAASERHADGDIMKSIDHNRIRFRLDDADLSQILKNTVRELQWS